MCLAKGHNTETPVRLEPLGLQSSTLPLNLCAHINMFDFSIVFLIEVFEKVNLEDYKKA